MNQKQTLLSGSLLGLLGVALGAFGAHALKNLLVENGRLETYELAVRYQFYHAFAMLITGMLMPVRMIRSDGEKFNSARLRWASLLFLIGVILFSGSLYLFALTNITAFAMITPFGGLIMLGGWGSLAYSIMSQK